MPRKPNIPFGDKRRAELNKVNRNIRSKQRSLSRRFEGLQADFKVKSASDFTSIKEYNQYIQQAKNFTKRTANKFDLVNPSNNKRISYNVLKKIEKEVKRVNRIKDKAFQPLKDRPHMELGRPTGLTIGQNMDKRIGFSDPKFSHFKHIEFHPKELEGEKDALLTLHKLKERYTGDFMGKRDNQYFRNYIDSLHTRFNKSPHPFGMDLPPEIWSIIDSLLDMGQDEFMQLYYDGKIPNIPFIYGKDEEEIILDELKQAFNRVA